MELTQHHKLYAFLMFVGADLIITPIGLGLGFWESSPGAYIFGYNPLAIIMWLFIQKIVAFFGLDFLVSKLSCDERSMSFLYGGLTFLGAVATFQNIRYLTGG